MNPTALGELRGLVEVPRLLLHGPRLARVPRGDGAAVLVLPGRSTDDLSTLPLRSYLRCRGHAASGWGRGTNDGDLPRLIPIVAEQVLAIAVENGGPIPLVGQSMGGSIAREVARREPAAVSQVITLGSPIMSTMDRRPLDCPLTVIYSKADRIVPPHWALASGDEADVIEVSSTHFSMGLDPDVWAIVADRLARSAPPH